MSAERWRNGANRDCIVACAQDSLGHCTCWGLARFIGLGLSGLRYEGGAILLAQRSSHAAIARLFCSSIIM
jgi:hypothetical protein